MSEQQLRESLESLRAEIERIADNRVEAKDRLNGLINDIEASLDTEEDSDEHTLTQNLRDAVAHFETEHPRATAILNDIMVTLSNMGI